MMPGFPNFDALTATPAAEINTPDKVRAAHRQLREACGQIEGMFLSILLKEGLKPVVEEAEGGAAHASSMLEVGIEQLAHDLGAQGGTGLANSFYEQFSANLPPLPRPGKGLSHDT